jgi:hypothetical protein
MAGLGKKTFVNGDVLPASELNGYLMEQSVMRFASAAARDTDIPSPTEGMMCYLDNVNWLMNYNGSSWVFVAGDRPYFFGTTSSQSLVTATNTALATTQSIITNRGSFALTATPGVITVPLTGIYAVTGAVEYGSSATGYRNANLDLNGTIAFRSRSMAVTTAATTSQVSISANILINAGGYIALTGYQNSGATLAVGGFLSVTYLGA